MNELFLLLPYCLIPIGRGAILDFSGAGKEISGEEGGWMIHFKVHFEPKERVQRRSAGYKKERSNCQKNKKKSFLVGSRVECDLREFVVAAFYSS